jgi:hypothetical protein
MEEVGKAYGLRRVEAPLDKLCSATELMHWLFGGAFGTQLCRALNTAMRRGTQREELDHHRRLDEVDIGDSMRGCWRRILYPRIDARMYAAGLPFFMTRIACWSLDLRVPQIPWRSQEWVLSHILGSYDMYPYSRA